MIDEIKLKELITDMQDVINEVNRISLAHRHNMEICREDLTELSHKQLDFEEKWYDLFVLYI